MDDKLRRRLRWFDAGAPAMRQALERLGRGHVFPDANDYYACPCCLIAHPREAVEAGYLTEEHVPPKRLGGQRLLLTCKDCNSGSGANFDAHAVTRSRTDKFARDFADNNAHERIWPVTFSLGGSSIRGTIQLTSAGIILMGIPGQNDPRVLDALPGEIKDRFDRGLSPIDLTFTLRGSSFDEARARISWIRSAYLAAFAGLGWAYILLEEMRPYRSQLQQPHVEIVPTYIAQDQSAPPDLRRIVLVTSPEELQCVAVTMGANTVFLPSPLHPIASDELMDRFVRQCAPENQLNVHFDGKEVPWPSPPTYLMDLHPEELRPSSG